WAPVLLLPIVAWVLTLDFTSGNGISWLCTILAVVAVLIAWISAKGGREGRAFAGLSVFVAFGALAIFTAMYPNVLPSTLDPAYSLTIANASSSEYTLGVMTFVTCLSLPVVFVYQAWTYWVFRKRLHVDHIPEAHDATELAELPTK
ncbi:MAG: cytochrome d ubiquinol oxidase subunit II, partial [Rothia mucilaginosa]